MARLATHTLRLVARLSPLWVGGVVLNWWDSAVAYIGDHGWLPNWLQAYLGTLPNWAAATIVALLCAAGLLLARNLELKNSLRPQVRVDLMDNHKVEIGPGEPIVLRYQAKITNIGAMFLESCKVRIDLTGVNDPRGVIRIYPCQPFSLMTEDFRAVPLPAFRPDVPVDHPTIEHFIENNGAFRAAASPLKLISHRYDITVVVMSTHGPAGRLKLVLEEVDGRWALRRSR
jgi:hypothetical protein